MISYLKLKKLIGNNNFIMGGNFNIIGYDENIVII